MDRESKLSYHGYVASSSVGDASEDAAAAGHPGKARLQVKSRALHVLAHQVFARVIISYNTVLEAADGYGGRWKTSNKPSVIVTRSVAAASGVVATKPRSILP